MCLTLEHVTLLNSILAVKGLILYRDHSTLSYGTLSFAEKVVVSGVETAAPFLSILSLSSCRLNLSNATLALVFLIKTCLTKPLDIDFSLFVLPLKQSPLTFLSSISRQTVERT